MRLRSNLNIKVVQI